MSAMAGVRPHGALAKNAATTKRNQITKLCVRACVRVCISLSTSLSLSLSRRLTFTSALIDCSHRRKRKLYFD